MKISAFGEVMLRLSPPEYLLLEQTNQLRMDFTGTGVNILGNLAHFGQEVRLLSALPNNRLGGAAKASLMKLGIDSSLIHFEHQHLGSFFAEMGYGARATQVTYQNRHHSSFGQSDASCYDFDPFVEQSDLIHICGISLSLTDATRDSAHTLAQKAHKAGKKICFDFNFRPSLNTEPDKVAFMKNQYQKILPYCDIVFGSTRDLTDLLGMEAASDEALIQQFMEKYEIQWFAGTKRRQKADNTLQGYLYTATESITSQEYPLTILDRIGAGDAYAAGILLGYAEAWDMQQTVDFATMNAVIAHTIHGDTPITTKEQVLMALEQPHTDLIR